MVFSYAFFNYLLQAYMYFNNLHKKIEMTTTSIHTIYICASKQYSKFWHQKIFYLCFLQIDYFQRLLIHFNFTSEFSNLVFN
jgi:hypothetical protein